jgi:carbonic anhydrase/acetyltransferase-like protein (isoleucine patch superfamily)
LLKDNGIRICVIAPGSATILNGAQISNGCIVGAGSLVPPGKMYEAGLLLIGSPARAVRRVTEEELQQLKDNATHYISNGKEYAAQGLR